jgi:hypothetical protein
MRDIDCTQRAEAATLPRRGRERDLLGVEIARAAERLRAAWTDNSDDIATLKRDLRAFR